MFSWTPSYSSAGTYPKASFTVTDGTLSTTQTVVFTIASAAQPVTLAPIQAQTVSAGYKLVILPQTTSAPGATLTFSPTRCRSAPH